LAENRLSEHTNVYLVPLSVISLSEFHRDLRHQRTGVLELLYGNFMRS